MSDKTEVAGKTTPNLRDETKTDNGSTFEKDYTVFVDGDEVPDEVHAPNMVDVRQSAEQRGLVPTGDVKLSTTEPVGDGSVRLIYAVPVKLNGPDTVTPASAVTVQPDDTAAKLAGKRKG